MARPSPTSSATFTGAPKGYVQISRIEPSHFDPGTCYVALDNHRNDDWKPYLFKTTDYGQTWTNVTGNLPANGNINALREDYDNPNLLFVGTEFGLYVTLDGGKEWKKFMTGLPSVRVDDILIHPRDRDLIIGDARPLDLDRGRHHSARTDEAEGRCRRRDIVRAARRPCSGRTIRRRSATSRTSSSQARIRKAERRSVFWRSPTWAGQGRVPAEQRRGEHHGCRYQGRHEPLPMADDGHCGGRCRSAAAAGGGRRVDGGGAGRGSGPRAGCSRQRRRPTPMPQRRFGGGGGGRGRGGAGGGVPFVSGGRGGGGGGGGRFRRWRGCCSGTPRNLHGALDVGDKTYMSSVDVLEDIWMRPQ